MQFCANNSIYSIRHLKIRCNKHDDKQVFLQSKKVQTQSEVQKRANGFVYMLLNKSQNL